MTFGSDDKAGNPLERRRALVREMYGGMIGRSVQEVPTPALLVDLGAAERNIARMATALETMPAKLRPHIKVHKSAELAARQVAAGAIGLSVASLSKLGLVSTYRSGSSPSLVTSSMTGSLMAILPSAASSSGIASSRTG